LCELVVVCVWELNSSACHLGAFGDCYKVSAS